MTDQDRLDLDLETMRRLGYQTVDALIDWLGRRDGAPVIGHASRAEMRRRLEEPAPEQPSDFSALLCRLERDVLPYMSRLDHPRYFAYIPGFGTWPGALGDLIASACNIYTGSWHEAAGPSQLELTVLDWFKAWIGYPPSASGVLLSGGSAANMTALACAREALLGAMSDRVVAYVADQAHSSMARAARTLGFRPDQVRVLPVDDRYRLRADALRSAIEADLEAGRQPLFVAACAGSTNTGAVDPLPEIAEICRTHGVWFHVDAAYGGFAALTERGKRCLRGIELADSVTLDPHKWLYQPFECGCLLVRQGTLLRQAFEITPDYLRDSEAEGEEVNVSDLGLQLTRMCRALKVWLSIETFGLDAFRATIDRCLDLAHHAQRRIEASSRLELLHPATLGIVCFRRRADGTAEEDELARLNAGLAEALSASGLGMISSTQLRGRYALRLCVLNHTSKQEDVDRVLDWIERTPLAQVSRREPGARRDERQPNVDQPWLRGLRVEAAVPTVPLFASLDGEMLELVESAARERRAAAGEMIVRQWEATSDFYVVLEGSVEVRTADRHLADLEPGSFFGELAALDWGASFGYPRLASVMATSPTRLLVLPGETFRTLVRRAPGFETEIREAVRERLPGL